MHENLVERIERIFKTQMAESVGCTEPGAIALASSVAFSVARGILPDWIDPEFKIEEIELEPQNIRKIVVKLDRDVFKNAFAVGIPRTNGKSGIDLASVLGVFTFPKERKEPLKLFDQVNPEKLAIAETLKGRVECKCEKERSDLYISVQLTVESDHNEEIETTVKIEKKHDEIVYIERNGKRVFEKTAGGKDDLKELENARLHDLLSMLENLPDSAREQIKKGAEKNAQAVEGGKNNKYVRIGKILEKSVNNGAIASDLGNNARIKLAYAAEARMWGEKIEVMTSAGSGNQGLMVFLPILAAHEIYHESEERKIRALALAHIVTCYVTANTKVLSALCGCAVKAGIGATAGLTYYLGGGEQEIGKAIKNMAGSVTGMICDGAKVGCALKLCTSAEAAVQSALLAINGFELSKGNGIVDETPEGTIKNIGKICKAMEETDKEIVTIIDPKQSS